MIERMLLCLPCPLRQAMWSTCQLSSFWVILPKYSKDAGPWLFSCLLLYYLVISGFFQWQIPAWNLTFPLMPTLSSWKHCVGTIVFKREQVSQILPGCLFFVYFPFKLQSLKWDEGWLCTLYVCSLIHGVVVVIMEKKWIKSISAEL